MFIHSAPRSISRHLDWALTRVMGEGQPNQWFTQPASPGELRTQFLWQGEHGSGAALASELAGWNDLRFELTEHSNGELEASRWMYTPSLGLKRVQIDAAGNILLNENELRRVMQASGPASNRLVDLIEDLLATNWDAELEPFRCFGLQTGTTWVNRVG